MDANESQSLERILSLRCCLWTDLMHGPKLVLIILNTASLRSTLGLSEVWSSVTRDIASGC